MQIWFARAGEVPLRDQLATQLLLAIVSGELSPGKRLPSTRALARVFKLHANTVSAAYKQLEDLGLVESVRGSGVYVRAQHQQDMQRDALNALVVPFLRASQAAGFSRREIRDRGLLACYAPQAICICSPRWGLASACQTRTSTKVELAG
jgi:GntR family transcriptional regulator